MRIILTILFLISKAFAATYYLSATGSDANNGTSSATPWQTLGKVNDQYPVAGDIVLLKRGDTFYGFLQAERNGTAANPILYGAYGTGANPIVTGFTTVTAWTNLGGNIWESTNALSSANDERRNMVLINGVNTAKGRFPNTGWLPIQSHVGQTSVTNSTLNSSTTNWTGSQMVIRTSNFTMNRTQIASHSGGTLTHSGGLSLEPPNGFGFFLQDDSRTLDVQNEWYYNGTTKKFRVYSTSQPTDVKVAT
ncbi:MAG: hypothetical protein WKF91_21130, partial [Segetibacter sp.]